MASGNRNFNPSPEEGFEPSGCLSEEAEYDLLPMKRWLLTNFWIFIGSDNDLLASVLLEAQATRNDEVNIVLFIVYSVLWVQL